MSTDFLDVYLNSVFVGKLSSNNAELSFQYEPSYIERAGAVKLSTSLPLQAEKFEHHMTAPFFSGLLPDESVRKRLAHCLAVSDKNIFSLLKKIGGECAGAISVYPEGQSMETQGDYEYYILEDTEARQVLSEIDKRPMMVNEDDIRISGAGAQDKLIIALVDGKIAIPKGSTPSTHIIKPAIKGLETSVFNEFFCMKLAKALKLPVPEVHIHWLDGEAYYLIERYDREKSTGGKVVRLHQEDFCQAMNIPPEMKYEDDNGPTLQRCFQFLDERIERGHMAGVNRLILLRGVLFNFLVGNGDAHGKNFSLLYRGEAEELAPFYDILSTVAFYGPYKTKMAMKIAKKYRFRDVALRHFDVLASDIGLKKELVQKELKALSEKIIPLANELKHSLNQKKETESQVYDDIIKSINTF